MISFTIGILFANL